MSMSRGKGRGSARGISNIEALGIKRDSVPPPLLHPPPLFPPLEKKPLELKSDETSRCLLLISQEWHQRMRQSPFYLKPVLKTGTNTIVKYSDRYKTSTSDDLTDLLNSIPYWKNYMPKELHFMKRKSSRKHKPTVLPQATSTSTRLAKSGEPPAQPEIGERLKQLEEKEEVLVVESEEEEGLKTEDEYYDEEVEEEEGDYQQTYFDPGDEFGVDEDDALDDGPSY